jgi:hypothetical protein
MTLVATTWVPTAELSSMRAEATLSLPDVATIRDFTEATDSQGGKTRTWSDTAESYCRLVPYPGQSQEGAVEGRIEADTTWLILLPQGTVATSKSRVRVNSIDWELIAQEDQATEPIYTAFQARRVV